MNNFRMQDEDFIKARHCRKVLINFFDNYDENKEPEFYIPIQRKFEEFPLTPPDSSSASKSHFEDEDEDDEDLPLKIELNPNEEAINEPLSIENNELSFEMQLNSLTNPRLSEEGDWEDSPPKSAPRKVGRPLKSNKKPSRAYKKCLICNKTFNVKSTYFQHILKHKLRTLKKVLQCQLCHKICVSSFGLKLHSERIHGKYPSDHELKASEIEITEGKIKCKDCDQLIDPVSSTLHIKKFHGNLWAKNPQGRIQCKLCSKSVVQKFFLRHMRSHKSVSEKKRSKVDQNDDDTDKIKCKECGKMITEKHFYAHMTIHKLKQQGRQFKCKFCDYSSVFKGSVKSHMNNKHVNMNKSLMNATINYFYKPLKK